MPDLISREYVLTEYDRQHQGPPGGARKIMEEAPAIDAISVEWLKEKRVTHPTTDAEILHNSVIRAVLVMWEREQEART